MFCRRHLQSQVRSYSRCHTPCSSFFFNDTATTKIYTLSLHDALPILRDDGTRRGRREQAPVVRQGPPAAQDRKSTRLNSSHLGISYAVFCLKKKDVVRHGGRTSRDT